MSIIIEIKHCGGCQFTKWDKGLYCIANYEYDIEPGFRCSKTNEWIDNDIKNKRINYYCPLKETPKYRTL